MNDKFEPRKRTKDPMKEKVTKTIEQAISYLQENKEDITHVFCCMITENKMHIDMSITNGELANMLYNLAKSDENIREVMESVITHLE